MPDINMPSIDVPLAAGARSTTVIALQQVLRDNGFNPGTIDGIVGGQTIAASQQAVGALANNPMQGIKDLAYRAAAIANSSVQAFVNLLLQGFKLASGSPTQGPPSDATPVVTMDRTEAVEMEKSLGLRPAWSPLKIALGLAGVGLAGLAIYSVASGSGRRRSAYAYNPRRRYA